MENIIDHKKYSEIYKDKIIFDTKKWVILFFTKIFIYIDFFMMLVHVSSQKDNLVIWLWVFIMSLIAILLYNIICFIEDVEYNYIDDIE